DLRAAFLAGDVEHLHLRAQRIHRLQQQRRLADARVAADQHDAAGDDAAAEHAVQLLEAGGRACDLRGVDLAQRGHRLAARERLETILAARAFRDALDQRVPRAAVRAAPQPLGRRAAAFVAREESLVLGHARDCPWMLETRPMELAVWLTFVAAAFAISLSP